MSIRVKVSKVFVDGREMAGGKDIEVEFDDDWLASAVGRQVAALVQRRALKGSACRTPIVHLGDAGL